MTLPNFICIGAQKAGTTWLYETLAQNPSIWLPPLKEVHFFDRMDAPERAKTRRVAHIAKLAERIKSGKGARGSKGKDQAAFLESLAGDDVLTEDWYKAIFAHPDAAGRVSGEITPAYLSLEAERIAYVAEFLPTTKFVLIVREPKARALSQLKMAAGRAKNLAPSEQEWRQFLRRITINERGNYARDIPNWRRHFGEDRLLILPFSLLRDKPLDLVRAIEAFIGAKPFTGYKALAEQVHKTREVVVPDWVAEKVAELAAPQAAYLVEAFGQDFYDKTR